MGFGTKKIGIDTVKDQFYTIFTHQAPEICRLIRGDHMDDIHPSDDLRINETLDDPGGLMKGRHDSGPLPGKCPEQCGQKSGGMLPVEIMKDVWRIRAHKTEQYVSLRSEIAQFVPFHPPGVNQQFDGILYEVVPNGKIRIAVGNGPGADTVPGAVQVP